MADLQALEQLFHVDVDDVEYLRHGDDVFLARVFQPRGEGPFPAMVDVHGGAWTEGDRSANDAINIPLARRGVTVVSIDFRVPPGGVYPASVQDVNYAVRWVKAHSERFRTTPGRVGLMGTSSGGHLAVLAALRPLDPRYAAIPIRGSVDACVPLAVVLWPVICPLTRYRTVVLGAGAGGDSARAGNSPKQMTYWLTEDAMREGSPGLAVARGDDIALPRILYVQNPQDRLHPYTSALEFATNYRARGGSVEMHLFEGAAYNRVRTDPESPEARAAIERIAQFVGARSDTAVAPTATLRE